MQKELNAIMIILLFSLTTVQSESFRYHSHSDEAERKFSEIEREGLFYGQMSLLDWVSEQSQAFRMPFSRTILDHNGVILFQIRKSATK